jgi:hypothetical protein
MLQKHDNYFHHCFIFSLLLSCFQNWGTIRFVFDMGVSADSPPSGRLTDPSVTRLMPCMRILKTLKEIKVGFRYHLHKIATPEVPNWF